MKTLLIALLSLSLCACGRSNHSATDASPPEVTESNGSATITAAPNPVQGTEALASTTVIWKTGSVQAGQVYVAKHGGNEQLFASRASGSKKVPWISKGTDFEFRLYQGTQQEKVLAQVKVKRQ